MVHCENSVISQKCHSCDDYVFEFAILHLLLRKVMKAVNFESEDNIPKLLRIDRFMMRVDEIEISITCLFLLWYNVGKSCRFLVSQHIQTRYYGNNIHM